MIYNRLLEAKQKGRKQLAVLIDPDKTNREAILHLTKLAAQCQVDYFFWGGSIITSDSAEYYLSLLRAHTEIPVVLFPGSVYQLTDQADALLLLSLISGRNPDLLIGQQVLAAPRIRRLGLEAISTGYMLIDGGNPSSVSYMSNTQPIPADKIEIACSTALAGEMLGMKLIYLDAGSGARRAVSANMVRAVRKTVNCPLIVGGGLSNPEAVHEVLKAGADCIVVGNSLEENPDWLLTLSAIIQGQGISV